MIKWTGIGLAIVAGLAIAAFATFILTARSFAQSDQIARGVSIQGIDVGGQTKAEAADTLRQQWLPGLPEQINLRIVRREPEALAPPPPHDAPAADAPDEDAPDARDSSEEPASSQGNPADTAAADDQSSETVTDEIIEIASEQLGTRPQIDKAAAEAFRRGREGSAWQQALSQLRIKREGADIAVAADVDEAILRSTLVNLMDDIKREPRDAKVTLDGEKVSIDTGQTGRELDVDASIERMLPALADPAVDTVDLVVIEKLPEITEDMVADFQIVLAHYSTPFNPGREQRTHNLRLAMSMVNEKVLQPGEEFSANETTGERLVEKGYQSAPIFLRGEVVPSTGGGVCQVASTLYNAALLANLDVTERHHHSRPVDYCPSGRDATLYYGQYDLKFVNTLKHPILIFGFIKEARLHAVVIGHKDDDYDVELIRSGISRFGHGTKEQPDPELEEGKREVEKPGRGGAKATLTRVVKKDGKEISRDVLHHDVYPAQTELVRVGAKKPEEKPEDAETDNGGLAPAGGGTGQPGSTTPKPPDGGATPPPPAGDDANNTEPND